MTTPLTLDDVEVATDSYYVNVVKQEVEGRR